MWEGDIFVCDDELSASGENDNFYWSTLYQLLSLLTGVHE